MHFFSKSSGFPMQTHKLWKETIHKERNDALKTGDTRQLFADFQEVRTSGGKHTLKRHLTDSSSFRFQVNANFI